MLGVTAIADSSGIAGLRRQRFLASNGEGVIIETEPGAIFRSEPAWRSAPSTITCA
jgi:hypothetical protein